MSLICSLSVHHKWMKSLSVHSVDMSIIHICILSTCATLVTSPINLQHQSSHPHTRPPSLSHVCLWICHPHTEQLTGTSERKPSPQDENVAAQWRKDNKIHLVVLDQTTHRLTDVSFSRFTLLLSVKCFYYEDKLLSSQVLKTKQLSWN